MHEVLRNYKRTNNDTVLNRHRGFNSLAEFNKNLRIFCRGHNRYGYCDKTFLLSDTMPYSSILALKVSVFSPLPYL